MDRDPFIGAWRLDDFRLTDADGNTTRPLEGRLKGFILYTADGHMANANLQADGTYFSYFGSYDVLENQLVHHVEMCSDPKLIGTDQRRGVSFEDDRLVLTASPSISGGPGTTAQLVWKRA